MQGRVLGDLAGESRSHRAHPTRRDHVDPVAGEPGRATQSPPLTENFVDVPEVVGEPYEYEHVAAKETHLV